MIQLDTNLLIRAAHADAQAMRAFERWLDEEETPAISSIAWFEFICGPLHEDALDLVARVITGNIFPFDSMQAQRAADLFNATGRKRNARWDCMIAAAAMSEDARLATLNPRNFARFADAGLKLAAI